MPCAMSRQRKQVFAQNPGQAASIARFTKWYAVIRGAISTGVHLEFQTL